MSYLGYIKPLSGLLSNIESPRVLEIGVDFGQSTLPLVHNLLIMCDKFLYTGIDIYVRGEITQQLIQMKNIFIYNINSLAEPDINVVLHQDNSLNVLPALKERGIKYDLIMIDGDHNYYTVKRELEIIKDIIHPSTIIICDDYNTRWAEKDLYYSEKPEYKDINLATERKQTDKQGVRNAILDFMDENKNWSMIEYGHDPCIMFQNDHIDVKVIPDGPHLSDGKIMLSFKSAESVNRFKEESYAPVLG